MRDLFFNTPARKKFLKAESTELSHIASLVTHYALAHPEKHFELHSATNAMLVAPPVAGYSERVYQVFGKETLDQLIPVAARQALEHVGLPQPPPWRRKEEDEDGEEIVSPENPGEMRVHGFVSKPEIQKLNRNSIFVFVNGRLIRDRLVQHALTEAYRNIIPPTVYPVVLLFLEIAGGRGRRECASVEDRSALPPAERDARFCARLGARSADEGASGAAVRDGNSGACDGQPGADAGGADAGAEWEHVGMRLLEECSAPLLAQDARNGAPSWCSTADSLCRRLFRRRFPQRFQFEGGIAVEANAAVPVARGWNRCDRTDCRDSLGIAREVKRCPIMALPALDVSEEEPTLSSLGTLKPLGQIRNSFILAVNEDGLWIVDQHVAHERVLV